MEYDDPAYNDAMEGMEVVEEDENGGVEMEEGEGMEEEDEPVTQEDAWAVIGYVQKAI